MLHCCSEYPYTGILEISHRTKERKESERNAAAAAKSLQSCPTLCDPTDGSLPGSPVPGILKARTLDWVAIQFSSVAQLCLTLCDPMDCSPSGSSVLAHRTVEINIVYQYYLEKAMATHSSVLALRIPGTGEPGGLPSMGSHRVGHD